MRSSAFLFGLILLFSIVFCAPRAEADVLRVVMDREPAEQGQMDAGPLYSTARTIVFEVCRRLGLTPRIHSVPWARALDDVYHGEADMICGLFRNPEREAYLVFCDYPMLWERTVVVARAGKGVSLDSLADLRHSVVGVVRGYDYGERFNRIAGLTLESANDNQLLLRKLLAGRCEVIMGNWDVLMDQAIRLGVAKDIEVVLEVERAPLFLAFSRKLGDRAEALASEFDRVLREMEQDGTLARLRGLWGLQ